MTATDLNASYVGERDDIMRLVPPESRKVLDVGCSIGTLGSAIKEATGAEVVGIELSAEMAEVAATRLDRVLTGRVEETLSRGGLRDLKFDTIIFADLLEHLADPWSVLNSMVEHLEPGGAVIASIPNVRHIHTILNLVCRGDWPYRDRGIHDRSHLRFFTRKKIVEMFEDAELSIERIEANYRIVEKPHELNRWAKYLAIPGLRDFIAFQYLLRARRAG